MDEHVILQLCVVVHTIRLIVRGGPGLGAAMRVTDRPAWSGLLPSDLSDRCGR